MRQSREVQWRVSHDRSFEKQAEPQHLLEQRSFSSSCLISRRLMRRESSVWFSLIDQHGEVVWCLGTHTHLTYTQTPTHNEKGGKQVQLFAIFFFNHTQGEDRGNVFLFFFY